MIAARFSNIDAEIQVLRIFERDFKIKAIHSANVILVREFFN